jgi:hypothetical protein
MVGGKSCRLGKKEMEPDQGMKRAGADAAQKLTFMQRKDALSFGRGDLSFV